MVKKCPDGCRGVGLKDFVRVMKFVLEIKDINDGEGEKDAAEEHAEDGNGAFGEVGLEVQNVAQNGGDQGGDDGADKAFQLRPSEFFHANHPFELIMYRALHFYCSTHW